MNKNLLKHRLMPKEYIGVTKDIVSPLPIYNDYWGNIPEYLIARCPLCYEGYSAQLDTYSLKYWVRPEHGKCVYREYAQKINCNHFVRTHHFINLNSLQPDETEFEKPKTLGVEVPYVSPFWLPEDINAYAVMHALPICKPEVDRFVPCYSLYIITYYSENPAEMLERRWKVAQTWSTLLSPEMLNEQEIFNLAKWVKARKLWWIDPTNSEMMLLSKSLEKFPYLNIEGSRKATTLYPSYRHTSETTIQQIRLMEFLALESDQTLEEFCKILAQSIGLPEFEYDSENESEWGQVQNGPLKVNVSKPFKKGTLQKWDESTPIGCNFSIHLTVSDEASPRWDSEWSFNELVPKYAQLIANVTDKVVFHHRTWFAPGKNISRDTHYMPNNDKMVNRK